MIRLISSLVLPLRRTNPSQGSTVPNLVITWLRSLCNYASDAIPHKWTYHYLFYLSILSIPYSVPRPFVAPLRHQIGVQTP